MNRELPTMLKDHPNTSDAPSMPGVDIDALNWKDKHDSNQARIDNLAAAILIHCSKYPGTNQTKKILKIMNETLYK